jgi:hypothetical protein
VAERVNADPGVALYFYRFHLRVHSWAQAGSRGWLLYFCFWIFALLFSSLRDIAQHPNAFRPSLSPSALNHEALVLAVFPRLLVYLATAVIAIILVVKREWVWVERLRVALMAGVVIAGFSLWLDIRYFPKATLYNTGRWIGLCLWLAYFFVSKRVHHVFRTHDSDKFASQITTDS